MRPLARVALAVALTPAALLTLVFADRLWVTAIRPELVPVLNARKRSREIRRQLREVQARPGSCVTLPGRRPS